MATYRFLRWDILKRKGPSTNSIQIDEFEARDEGVTQSWPGGTTVTATYATSPSGEQPSNLIDGTTSKWLEFEFRVQSEIVIDVGSGNTVTFDGYRYQTVDTAPEVDPVSWTLEGSDDGTAYDLLDTQDFASITTDRDTFTQEFSVTSSTYRYLRWTITHLRGKGTSSGRTTIAGAAEFELRSSGSPVSWPGATTVTNPNGSNPVGEEPANLIDGTAAKWGDGDADVNGESIEDGHSRVVIDTGAGNSITLDSYRWQTANDAEARDPVSWELYGSDDGSAWTLLDTRTDETITSSRNTFTSDFTITEAGTPVGLATETDTAQPITTAKSKAIGLASESDTALSIGAAKLKTAGLAAESDTALPITARKTKTLGLTTESDTALVLVTGPVPEPVVLPAFREPGLTDYAESSLPVYREPALAAYQEATT